MNGEEKPSLYQGPLWCDHTTTLEAGMDRDAQA